jgi:twitching motility protein PilI
MNAPRQDLRARQTRLHDYQAMLARRLREARNLPAVDSYLGVLVGQRNWLLPLTGNRRGAGNARAGRRAADAAVVSRPGQRARQPARRDRFRHVLRRRPDAGTAGQQDRRAVASCGTGLRHHRHARGGPAPCGGSDAGRGEEPGAGWARFADRDGRDWQVLDIGQLLDAPAFLQAGRSVA